MDKKSLLIAGIGLVVFTIVTGVSLFVINQAFFHGSELDDFTAGFNALISCLIGVFAFAEVVEWLRLHT